MSYMWQNLEAGETGGRLTTGADFTSRSLQRGSTKSSTTRPTAKIAQGATSRRDDTITETFSSEPSSPRNSSDLSQVVAAVLKGAPSKGDAVTGAVKAARRNANDHAVAADWARLTALLQRSEFLRDREPATRGHDGIAPGQNHSEALRLVEEQLDALIHKYKHPKPRPGIGSSVTPT